MTRKLDHSQPARNVEFAPPIHFRDERMAGIASAEDLRCDFLQAPLVNLLDGENGKQFVLRVTKCNVAVETDRLLWIDRHRHRYREHNAIGESQFIEHALMIRFAHETI